MILCACLLVILDCVAEEISIAPFYFINAESETKRLIIIRAPLGLVWWPFAASTSSSWSVPVTSVGRS